MKNYALSLTSAFNSSQILKFRIVMIYQKTSKKIALSKFLLAIPVLALCFFVSALMQKSPAKPLAEVTPAPYPTPATYTVFSSVLLEANAVKKLHYLFAANQEYMFVFIDLKTQKQVSPPAVFDVLDMYGDKMRYTKISNALYYSFKEIGNYIVELNNASNSPILLKIYVKDRKIQQKELLQKKSLYQPLFFQQFVIPEKKDNC
jgi:hypothetical protein